MDSGRDKATRIFVVDDHQIVITGLTALISRDPLLTLLGSATDTRSAWEQIRKLKPDIVLMDLSVPEEGGVALTDRIRCTLPDTKVIVFTGYADPASVVAAFEAGAQAIVLKMDADPELFAALRKVQEGGLYISAKSSGFLADHIRQRFEKAAGPKALSDRELQILRGIAEGKSIKELAFDLGLSPKTIVGHRQRLMDKIGVKSTAELIKYAVREGLTQL